MIDTTTPADMSARLQALSDTAGFNKWADFRVVAAGDGESELRMTWRSEDMGQYAGFLHAGLIAALLDTACGFAAATVAGRVLASQISVSCLAPAVGTSFTAHGHVVRAGRKLVFTSAELHAETDAGARKLVATATTVLVPSGEPLSV